MTLSPKIQLAVDLQKLERYFPINREKHSDHSLDMFIDKERYDVLKGLLGKLGIEDGRIVHEFCFIVIWIENVTGSGSGQEMYQRMWAELDLLKEYLLKNRVTSITLHGEIARNLPGEGITLKEEINIDRVCDGLRVVFREEFDYDKPRRRTKGQTNWKRRRLMQARNNILNFFSSISELDDLELQEQNQLIDLLSEIAGISV